MRPTTADSHTTSIDIGASSVTAQAMASTTT